MKLPPEIMNRATFVGIDAHPDSHMAIATNRFLEEKGHLEIANTTGDIEKLMGWLAATEPQATHLIIGIEGGGDARHALLRRLLSVYQYVFEVNPVYTNTLRSMNTTIDKTDFIDALLVAEILTIWLKKLPLLLPEQLSEGSLMLRRATWEYEEVTTEAARIKNQLHKLNREKKLTKDSEQKAFYVKLISNRKEQLRLVNRHKRLAEKNLKQLIKSTGTGTNLITMKGVAEVTAARLVTHTNCMKRFGNRRQYLKYSGLAPIERSSGKGKHHMPDMRGNRQLNSVLYYAALNRIRHDPAIKELHEKRVANGQTKTDSIRYIMSLTARTVRQMLITGEDYRLRA